MSCEHCVLGIHICIDQIVSCKACAAVESDEAAGRIVGDLLQIVATFFVVGTPEQRVDDLARALTERVLPLAMVQQAETVRPPEAVGGCRIFLPSRR